MRPLSLVEKGVDTVRLVSLAIAVIVRSVSPATATLSPTLKVVLNFVAVPVRIVRRSAAGGMGAGAVPFVATVPGGGFPTHSVGGVPGKVKLVGSTIAPETFVFSARGLPATSVTLFTVT